ncbi:RNA-binding protein [Sedimenticola selenatireducens]|uniref:RNA recognition motif domain-containing protein n=1 Tax=Sedimenticola selenatireducens TaxID=191960 RepID=UPI0012F77650|nr:RNA-binding protein [Sedimenticola selenatireducens]
MEIFIRRLPNSTTRLDLMQFVSEALRPKWYLLQFSPIGTLGHCDICRIDNPKTKQVEYHGIVHVDPPSAALSLINRLNGEIFKTKKVEVRKFFRRSTKRDRRRTSLEQISRDISEKRKQDRRRSGIQIDYLHAGITTDKKRPAGRLKVASHH